VPTGEAAKHYISAQEALDMAGKRGISVTLATLLDWVGKHELGIQPGGPGCRWYIDKNSFRRFLDGKKYSA